MAKITERCCVDESISIHLAYNPPLLSAKVHRCCIMALWGGQAKGEIKEGGQRGRRGCEERQLMTGRRRKIKQQRVEERTLKTSGKSFKNVSYWLSEMCDHKNDS